MIEKRAFFIAYLWNMLGKLVIRSLGIVSTLFLVRLLAPEDFGIVAIATMFIGFSRVLTNSGINRYLLLQTEVSQRDYDLAWTTNIMLRALALLITWLIAPSVSSFMDMPDLIWVIRIIALITFMETFNSVGLIQFEREMNFGPVNRIRMIAKICAVATTISMAFYYRSYYALIIGSFIYSLCVLILSYYITSRPLSFVFQYSPSLMSFYGKLLSRNIVGYTRAQIDTLIIGKLFGNAAVGGYSIARQFAILPQTEIIGPAMQPNFSYLSSIKDSHDEFLDKAYQSLFLMYCFVIPSATGLLYLAEPFVMVVLGDGWTQVIDYIGMLAFLMLPFSTQPLLHTVYDARAKTGVSLFTDLFGLLLIIAISILLPLQGTTDFVDYRILVGITALVFSILMAKWLLNMSLIRFFIVLLIPSVLSYLMYKALVSMSDLIMFGNHYADLIVNTLFGAIIYVACLAIVLVLVANMSALRQYRRNIPIFIYTKFKLS